MTTLSSQQLISQCCMKMVRKRLILLLCTFGADVGINEVIVLPRKTLKGFLKTFL